MKQITKLFIKYFRIGRDWIQKNLSIHNQVLTLSIFAGVFGATSAVILKNVVHYVVIFLKNSFPEDQFNYLYLAFPLIGIALTVYFVKRFVKDDISHGVSKALWAISKNKGIIKPHNMWSSMAASTITVGFGGSVGLEAPIVLTGSAIGSGIGKSFHFNHKNTVLLLACGCTGAVAAVFKAPITAIVFAFEVLMLDLTTAAMLPLLVSAVAGTTLSYFFMGDNVMFSAIPMHEFALRNIPFYLILGLFTGFVSLYFLKLSAWIEQKSKLIKKDWIKILIGGIILGGLIFVFPVLYGEGYDSINAILHQDYTNIYRNSPFYFLKRSNFLFLIILFGIIIFKAFATSFTNSGGGIGGVFAPSLFLGAFSGLFIGIGLNSVFDLNLPIPNFILAGMAGVMAGTMHAPLTAIFLIAEMSGGYSLFVPLMISSGVAYLTSHKFEHYSVYTRSLAIKGELKTHNKDAFAIQLLDLEELMDNNIAAVKPNYSLRQLTEVIAHSKRNIFVVLNDDNKFAGIVIMDDYRDILFKQELYDTIFVKDMMIKPDVTIDPDDTVAQVIQKFIDYDKYNLAIVNKKQEYIGYLSRAKLFSAYRELVKELSED